MRLYCINRSVQVRWTYVRPALITTRLRGLSLFEEGDKLRGTANLPVATKEQNPVQHPGLRADDLADKL